MFVLKGSVPLCVKYISLCVDRFLKSICVKYISPSVDRFLKFPFEEGLASLLLRVGSSGSLSMSAPARSVPAAEGCITREPVFPRQAHAVTQQYKVIEASSPGSSCGISVPERPTSLAEVVLVSPLISTLS